MRGVRGVRGTIPLVGVRVCVGLSLTGCEGVR